jgi:FSR family fosmidomycin resistance protein-like MFS transporter
MAINGLRNMSYNKIECVRHYFGHLNIRRYFSSFGIVKFSLQKNVSYIANAAFFEPGPEGCAVKVKKKLLALLGMGHAITDINQGALPIILTFLQPVFALSQFQVGLATLAFNLSSSVVQPIFGVLSDRIRAAWLIPLGCFIAGLGIAYSGFANSYTTFLLAMLVSGLGVAAYHPEASKFARFASGERKGAGMSLFSVGGNAGFAIGPVLVSIFFGIAGLHGSIGFIILNTLMAVLLWVNLSRITATQLVAQVPQDPVVRPDPAVNDSNGQAAKVVVPVILLVLVVTVRSWTHLGFLTFLPQYYVHTLHQSKNYAALLTSVYLVAGVFGTLVGGPLADRIGLKKEIILSMAALIPLFYLFSHVQGFWRIVIIALTGFLVVSTFAVTIVFGQELLPHNVGLASGLVLGFGVGMGGIGTTLLGWVADVWGLPAVFHVIAVFPIIALLLTLFLPDRRVLIGKKDIDMARV